MKSLFGGQLPALVLFDFDGTLIDCLPDLAAGIDRMLADLGRPAAGEEKVSHWIGNGAAILVRRALLDRYDIADSEPDALSEQALELFLRHYGEVSGQRSRLYPGVEACLETLASLNIPMALVTNKPLPFTEHLLQQFGLDKYFRLVLGGDCLAEKKPHPLPLLHAMKVLNAEPLHTLMVGDSANDILAAKAAECPVVAVSYGFNHGKSVAEYQPDLILDSLADLAG
ncbi:phosphoglycolate phosphatase [Aliamphritea spongicola]|uniref:phosphoglycolate phosphatase n=1 Tax=Aliamphritea spongicola TaxID=707589 RepID=UPI00196B5BA6|nr:phosphoglycolate phosphatase [Aliamphritea spongicola]MBN3563768.1 phosphoglycolate phosphatase [Aliamphritea spongicola]